MKIVNISIACFYIEGWSYQENTLPKYQKKNANDVFIITSRFDKDEKDSPKLREAGEYINADLIPVFILDYAKTTLFQKLLRAKPVSGLYEKLCQISPDIIFVHGGQTVTVFDIIKYKKKHPEVKIFADQHGDYYNMPVRNCGWKKMIMNRYIMKYYVRSLAKYTEKYWGVTPWRVRYLQDVYGLKPEQTDLLIMGADDDYIDIHNQPKVRKEIRDKYGISENDFVLITGGKIDRAKNILTLMKLISNICCEKTKLVVFGTPSDDISSEFDAIISENENIINVGWLKDKNVCDWFAASDLIVFPGTHSVLWEQAVASGTPCVFKKWEGMMHVDIGGNCLFLENDSPEEMNNKVSAIILDKLLYFNMKKSAISNKRKEFLYSEIAKKSIKSK